MGMGWMKALVGGGGNGQAQPGGSALSRLVNAPAAPATQPWWMQVTDPGAVGMSSAGVNPGEISGMQPGGDSLGPIDGAAGAGDSQPIAGGMAGAGTGDNLGPVGGGTPMPGGFGRSLGMIGGGVPAPPDALRMTIMDKIRQKGASQDDGAPDGAALGAALGGSRFSKY